MYPSFRRAATPAGPTHSGHPYGSAQVSLDDSARFLRERASSLYAKARRRFPFVEPDPPDRAVEPATPISAKNPRA